MHNANHDARIARLTFASIYPFYVAKVQRKGRTEAELQQVILWLTGFSVPVLQALITAQVSLVEFFNHARLHPNAGLITVMCGYRVEEIHPRNASGALSRQIGG